MRCCCERIALAHLLTNLVQGIWPNSVPYLTVLQVNATALTVKDTQRVQLSSIGICNFFDGTDYWVPLSPFHFIVHLHSFVSPIP